MAVRGQLSKTWIAGFAGAGALVGALIAGPFGVVVGAGVGYGTLRLVAKKLAMS